ncbi:MAG: hypothetical protein ACRDJO_07380 [Actinomycetota bacterium]
MGPRRLVGVLALVVALAAGCSGESGGGTPTSAPRPSSTGMVSIVEPTPGTVVSGDMIHVKVEVDGARILADPGIVAVKPDEGHIHVSLDGKLQNMLYDDETDVAVTPGRHLLEVEFVAGDHIRFNPAVKQAVTFTVEG